MAIFSYRRQSADPSMGQHFYFQIISIESLTVEPNECERSSRKSHSGFGDLEWSVILSI